MIETLFSTVVVAPPANAKFASAVTKISTVYVPASVNVAALPSSSVTLVNVKCGAVNDEIASKSLVVHVIPLPV